MNGLSRNFRYRYFKDGYDHEGEKIPDIPVIYILIETKRGRARGPAIVDTGFDGGIYPNIQVIKILRDIKPVKIKYIENPVYGRVACEVFEADLSLIDAQFQKYSRIGTAYIYVPTEPQFISDEVLIGREILNKFLLKLDGYWVEVEKF